ncbi:MAG: hypothetical protein U5R06_08075 [candidate division KSB1 bacterium]|nr:hypothetical protein [candidate division KSB1 bacterium]
MENSATFFGWNHALPGERRVADMPPSPGFERVVLSCSKFYAGAADTTIKGSEQARTVSMI